MKKILYFIQLPPPVHGVTVMNEFIFNNTYINNNIHKDLLEIRFSNSLAELGKTNINKIKSLFILIKKLIHKINTFKPDYVYFTIVPIGKAFYRDAFFVLIIKLFRIKIIYHLHGKGINKSLNSYIKRKLYEYIFNDSFIIHLSQGLLKDDFKNLNLKNSKLFYLENCILEERNIFKKKIFGNRLNLLYLANLQKSKGLYILLEAVGILLKKTDNFMLDIIGDFRDDITKKLACSIVKKYNMLEYVTFHGAKYHEEKIEFYSNADLFVYPTLNDAFPLAVIEAMSFGIPVVSTKEGAIPEIIKDGENGYIVDKNDTLELSNKIYQLITNPKELQIFSKKAFDTYQKRFTKTFYEEKMQNIFNTII